ncbi:MAG TPA: O-antigen ligase family protein [Pyrinomonadaceae bacterium]|nr:O-antigen ligase family protein [Pyrinomonadaceae bacterium]
MRKIIFAGLLGLIVVAAIPYGTIEAWWKAAVVFAAFGLCILAIIEGAISGSTYVGPRSILLPLVVLAAFAFVQTISFTQQQTWQAISADPYQTRFFVLQILALTICLALLYRYASNERYMRIMVHVVIAVGVASAIFGILRQSTQQHDGFVIPLLRNQGYGQFLNKNHFAYLMEMAFGLGLGMILARGVRRDRLMMYAALMFPIWIALVLSNSRGGIVAMLTQIIVAVLWMSSQRVVVKAALVAVLVAGVLIGTLWVGGDKLATNIESASTDFAGDTTRDGASRNEIWRATLKMFAAHPLAGVGFGGYWIGITAYHDASGTLTPQEAHNEYLEVLSSGGLIGFAILVWFAVSVFRKVQENLRSDRGFVRRSIRFSAVLGMIGVVVHSLLDFGLHLMGNALIFFVLIMLATASVNEKVIDPGVQQQ